MEPITVSHSVYGSVIWHPLPFSPVPGCTLLFADPLPEKRRFSDPSSSGSVRYLRSDYSSSYPVLYETEQPNGGASARYADLTAYGCNQWAVSSLRAYLNGEFLAGLDPAFASCIVPYKHDMFLSSVPSALGSSDRSAPFLSSDGIEVYDTFANGVRSSYASTADSIFLPTSADAENESFRRFMLEMPYIFLMDADPFTTFLVRIAAPNRDIAGNAYVRITTCNANTPLHVCPMCLVSSI